MTAALQSRDVNLGKCWVLPSFLPGLAGPLPWCPTKWEQHGKHCRPLPRWASLIGRSTGQGFPLKAKAAPGEPLSDAPQMLVLPQEHPISSPHSRRGSACASKTALLGQALLLKLFIYHFRKWWLSLQSGGFLAADCFCMITTYLLCFGWQVARCKHLLCLVSCLPIMRGTNCFALKPGSALCQVMLNTVATRVALCVDLVQAAVRYLRK